MRKAQKKQAEEFLNVLDEAHGQIKTAIENKNFPAALGILEDCQQGAISLGSMIEAAEGEDCAVIPILEKYCELVYQLHENIMQSERANGNKAYKNLRSFLLKIENSIKNDIKVRTEAVFLPYKASMWDSLESAWKAADEDPNCDAYVIPIPYYDKNPDGSFRKMHYEGSQYPDYVPVVRYEDYDFEGRQPDMIFIHNPYDNLNHVTSVHPDFYSDKLKKFTDKLIYIPYFVLNEISPDDKAAVDSMKHFCTCPGVLNADKTVVQSEDMRQIYINILTEYTKSYGYTRKDWESRILGLGSPKVDKVLNTKKEDLEIPKEWLKIIEKPDGSWKKIVFYNTGVSVLLQHEEKMLRKMRNVFRVFEENKEEVALLWRPHPLIKATIESMRPQLREEYEKIVAEYKEAGWGIYDDSADVDRAVVVSDGYYGDHSSIVNLYGKQNKPILIQDVNVMIRKTEQLYKLKCYGYIETEDKIFFSNLYFNGIIEIDRKTGKIHNLYRFNEYGVRSSYLYSTVCKTGDVLVFVPNQSDRIALFDLKSSKIYYFALDKHIIGDKKPYFRSAYEYNDSVYMFPSKASCIVKFEVGSGVISYIMIEEKSSDDMVLFRQEFEVVDDKVYIPFAEKGNICIFDLKTDTFKIVDLGIKGGFSTISYVKDRFWISSWEELCIYEWEEEKGIIKEYKNFPRGIEKGKYIFSCSAVIGDQIIFFPQQCNMIVSLNISTRSITYVEKLENWQDYSLLTLCLKEKSKGFNVIVSYEENILSITGEKDNDKICISPYLTLNSNFNKLAIIKYIAGEQGYFFMEPYQDLGNFMEMLEYKRKIYNEKVTDCGGLMYRAVKNSGRFYGES